MASNKYIKNSLYIITIYCSFIVVDILMNTDFISKLPDTGWCGLAIYYLKRMEKQSELKLSLPTIKDIGWIFGGFVLTIIWNMLGSTLLPLTQNQSTLNEVLATNSVVTALTNIYLVLIAPLTEELVFRGVIMVACEDTKKYHLGLILSSILFGFLHLIGYHFSFSDLLFYSISGAILGVVRQSSGKLSNSIFLHMLINFIATFVAP